MTIAAACDLTGHAIVGAVAISVFTTLETLWVAGADETGFTLAAGLIITACIPRTSG